MKLKPMLITVLTLSTLGVCSLISPQAGAQTAEPSASAPASLSLEQALRRVYQDNPALWRLRREQAIWEARRLQASLGPNPEFSFSGEDFAGSAAFTQDRFTQFTLGLAQTLMLGNKLTSRVRLTEVQQQLAYWDYRLQLRTLGTEVYQIHARLLTLQSEQTLMNELIANARAQHALYQKAVTAGRQAPSVLLQSESRIKALEAEALRLELQARGQRQNLALLWGGSVDFGGLRGDLPSAEAADWETLERRLQSHPRLARWNLEQQQRQLALESAQAQATPDLNLSGGLRYHPPLDWGLVLSLGVPFPIADNNQGNIQEARLRSESWQQERALEENQLRAQLRRAFDQAQGLTELIGVLREQIQLAEAQREAALKVFAAGRSGSFELLLAGQNVDQLRRKLLEVQGERLQAMVEILALTQDLLPDFEEAQDALRG